MSLLSLLSRGLRVSLWPSARARVVSIFSFYLSIFIESEGHREAGDNSDVSANSSEGAAPPAAVARMWNGLEVVRAVGSCAAIVRAPAAKYGSFAERRP